MGWHIPASLEVQGYPDLYSECQASQSYTARKTLSQKKSKKKKAFSLFLKNDSYY